jgi:hypothetical protein
MTDFGRGLETQVTEHLMSAIGPILKDGTGHYNRVYEAIHAEVRSLVRENTRLRETLTMLSMTPCRDTQPGGCCEIAREALAGDEEWERNKPEVKES